jgi:dTDP-4-dehydrorhamnose 3,5-epimerase-like enzyme
MTYEDHVKLVEAGNWPEDPAVPLPSAFEDGRGRIQNVGFTDFRSAAVITSARGTVRANHYHRTDWHYSYVLSGSILYFERPVGHGMVPSPRTFSAGTMFFTPPMREHAMVFMGDTMFLTLARNIRDHRHHEDDVERVEVVSVLEARALAGIK